MNKRKEMAELRNAMRLFVQANGTAMTDQEALSVSSLHDPWAAGVEYAAEQVLRHNDTLYRVVTAHTAQAHQPPDGEGMLAIYRPIVLDAAGTQDDPIPYTYGMDVTAGLYYSYTGSLWIAKTDMAPCVWPPADGNEWEEVV